MHVLKLVLIICLSVAVVIGQEPVCFHNLGCFAIGEPWNSVLRPVPPPQGPDVVKVFFVLYTRDNSIEPFYIYGETDWNVEGSYYDGQKPTIVVIHGLASSTNETWIEPMKDALLKNMDVNVIFVDYGSIKTQAYVNAVSNIRIIAAMTAKFLKYLIDDKGASPAKFHLVGHSLGAHVAGYVGKRIPGIGRITGLDAAQPLFEGENPQVRLDKGDAIFVDVAHTNGSPTIPLIGLGFVSAIGHVDFYFNGGWYQPECIPGVVGSVLSGNISILNAIPNKISCPHGLVLDYFTEAMRNRNCTFWGIKRKPLNALLRVVSAGWLSGILTSLSGCTIGTCIPFGQNTPDYPARGSFDIATNIVSPYCAYSPDTDKSMGRLLDTYKPPF